MRPIKCLAKILVSYKIHIQYVSMKRIVLLVSYLLFFCLRNLNAEWESLTQENYEFLEKIRASLNLKDDYGVDSITGVFNFVKDSENIQIITQGIDILLHLGNIAQIAGKKEVFRLVHKNLRVLINKMTCLKQWTVAEHIYFLLDRLPEDCKNGNDYCLGYWSYINQPGRIYLLIYELSKTHSRVAQNRRFINNICDKFLAQLNEYNKS